MAPVRRTNPKPKSSSRAVGPGSRGRQRTTRKATTKTATRSRGPPKGRGLRERNRGIQRAGAQSQRGTGRQVARSTDDGDRRPGEDVVRDPGKPRPDQPAEESSE